MKHRNRITAGLAITLLLSLGAIAFIPQAKASPDEGQVVSETEATTAELPAEAETPAEETPAEETPTEETSTEETSAEAETQEPKVLPNPQLAELGLDAPSSLDSNGSIPIPQDGTLLDIRLPEYLGEEALNAIAPGAFSGTSCLRSITLPASITEIGENAFADCPSLKYIVLLDRSDLEGMTLGENWNGDAEVIFALIVEEVPEVIEPVETEPAEETTEPSLPVTEQTEAESTETELTETEPAEETTEPSLPVTEPTEGDSTSSTEESQTAPSENLTSPEA